MSEQMMPKTKTVNMDPRATTRLTKIKQISILSPVIDDSSSLSSSTIRVTLNKKTPNKKVFLGIRKFLKMIMGEKSQTSKRQIQMKNNQTKIQHQV